jgi:glutathione S-transferase
MIILYHFPLCPFSRAIRSVLREKTIEFELIVENYWERNFALACLNPASEVPVLLDGDAVISSVGAIYEYLEEKYPNSTRLLGTNPEENAEIRRIAHWFHSKFYNEVTKYIINEKVIRFYQQDGQPDSESIRAARINIDYHLNYIEYLLAKRKWLAGQNFSYADIAAATQISVLDYLGDIKWDNKETLKNWYSVVKSRPSFRAILNDKISGFSPSKHYADLDF